jgi:hypothetical protein
MVSRFMICTPHQMLFRSSNVAEGDGQAMRNESGDKRKSCMVLVRERLGNIPPA